MQRILREIKKGSKKLNIAEQHLFVAIDINFKLALFDKSADEKNPVFVKTVEIKSFFPQIDMNNVVVEKTEHLKKVLEPFKKSYFTETLKDLESYSGRKLNEKEEIEYNKLLIQKETDEQIIKSAEDNIMIYENHLQLEMKQNDDDINRMSNNYEKLIKRAKALKKMQLIEKNSRLKKIINEVLETSVRGNPNYIDNVGISGYAKIEIFRDVEAKVFMVNNYVAERMRGDEE